MSLFESLLERHEQARHREIFSRLPLPRRPNPDRSDGFMPPAKAAAIMRVGEAELLEMAARGRLNWRKDGSTLLVQPAIVSVMAVETTDSRSTRAP